MQRKSVMLEDLPDEVAPTTPVKAKGGVLISVFILGYILPF